MEIEHEGRADGDVMHTFADGTRAANDIGFVAEVALAEGLDQEARVGCRRRSTPDERRGCPGGRRGRRANPRPSSSSLRARCDVSVVVPAFDEAESLPELVDRIEASLAPITSRFEVLVIDDGSLDDTHGSPR